jgi:lysophospholipase L1-like esterase
MQQVLLTLGDSWPEGAELNFGDKRYGELIQSRLGYDKFYNYGSAGASNEDMQYQLQRYVSESHEPGDQVTAIFFLTNPARTAHFPRFFSWESNADSKQKELYMHFHRQEHEIMRSSATVSALQAWCSNLGFADYYFSGWVRYPTWLSGVDTGKIWAQGNETVADWFGASKHNGEHLLDVADNIYIRPNFAHPNQLGHELIADRLISWISQAR